MGRIMQTGRRRAYAGAMTALPQMRPFSYAYAVAAARDDRPELSEDVAQVTRDRLLAQREPPVATPRLVSPVETRRSTSTSRSVSVPGGRSPVSMFSSARPDRAPSSRNAARAAASSADAASDSPSSRCIRSLRPRGSGLPHRVHPVPPRPMCAAFPRLPEHPAALALCEQHPSVTEPGHGDEHRRGAWIDAARSVCPAPDARPTDVTCRELDLHEGRQQAPAGPLVGARYGVANHGLRYAVLSPSALRSSARPGCGAHPDSAARWLTVLPLPPDVHPEDGAAPRAGSSPRTER